MTVSAERLRLILQGRVQGVGLRPFVRDLAWALHLSGWVRNRGDQVELEVQGPVTGLETFIQRLLQHPPPGARVETLVRRTVPAEAGAGDFLVLGSVPGAITRGPGADRAVCGDCLAELFDPGNRRYRHPFIHCTRCGPRYSLITGLPYDRARTTQADFPLCAACGAEYADPANRRCHAQTLACPDCGPRLRLRDARGRDIDGDDPVAAAMARLAQGAILALKGVGGYQLLCNARDAEAVARLRRRKRRPVQPMALMAAGSASLGAVAEVGPERVRRLLEDPARPIVLLEKAPGADAALPGVAPEVPWLGAMLPASPLHYLLFHEAAGRPAGTDWLQATQGMLLVCTSGNLHGDPPVLEDGAALECLGTVADLFLGHDRPIRHRVDDSVMQLRGARRVMVRRARGYAPKPLPLPMEGPSVLALGGALKNTFCLTRGDRAFVSPHQGDLDTPQACRALERAVRDALDLLQGAPELIACDLHPDFFSTRLAVRLANERGVPLLAVQHHHAHLAAVQAEHALEGPLLGLALDGYGLGTDGGAWGGELLLLEGTDFWRLGHLRPLALPGGDRAAVQPWRMGASALHALGRGGEIPGRFRSQRLAPDIRRLLHRGVGCPETTSLGRLFDAAAGLLGVLEVSGYEGEAALRLEGRAQGHGPMPPLSGGWHLQGGVLDFAPLLEWLSTPQRDAGEGAAVFHATVAQGLAAWVLQTAGERRLGRVALAGGCVLNRLLMTDLRSRLEEGGLRVYEPVALPPGDGGLSLGQAWVGICHLREL
ncbi:Hydrogenase maturation protein, carbamoyltransferase HypF [Ectothiorhodospira mobilis]|uniref:Carbamoyltransferase HypF n=1 Tax=Ectothiorhodospira mobilis TaxID=195064 RepID=A0A1I4PQ63_ECTMO|nr:carbamoyltransferase HypF [Ectothiorhodospira mobilis]SFM29869.1 Hydrogenase maturation protein, carbamoyltransferase HypF [Ectothiorhodospira mobilis]